MAFNFTEIIAQETQKQEQAAGNGSGGGIGFKTVYPFSNGRLEFKFIGNEPSGLLYREIYFHEYWSDGKKQKVPCLHNMYGMECPICNMVNTVQDKLQNQEVFGKYGFKKQGLMFAKLVNYAPENYFGDNRNPPKAGDIVIFMFPKSVINELRNMNVEYQDELESLYTDNTSRTVTLKVSTQANGFPGYSFFVKNTQATVSVDTNGNPDDNAFAEFMRNMPNLKEVKFPAAPDENIMKIHQTIVEEISNKYFGEPIPMSSNDVKPMAQPATPVNTNTNVETEASAPAPTAAVNTNTASAPAPAPVSAPVTESANTEAKGERPPCFGDNKYDDVCAKCPFESECV